jgi:hypothetical protein
MYSKIKSTFEQQIGLFQEMMGQCLAIAMRFSMNWLKCDRSVRQYYKK